MNKKIILKEDIKLYSRLLSHTRPYLGWILVSLIFSALYSVIDSGLIYALKPIVDKGFIKHDVIFIYWLPIFIIVAFLVRGGANIISSYTMSYAARSVIMRIRRLIFQHLLRLPATFYDHHSSAKILSMIIYNVETLANASADALTTVAQSGFLSIGTVIVIFIISWKLSMAILIAVPIIAFIVRYGSKKVRRVSYNSQEIMAEVSNTAKEIIKGYKIVRIFGGHHYETTKFNQLTRKHYKRELKNVLIKSCSTSSVEFIFAVALATIIYLVLSHHVDLTAGAFASLIVAALALLKPLKNMMRVNGRIQQGLAGAQSVFELLDQMPEKETGQNHTTGIKTAICCQHVTLAYHRQKQAALHDISFTLAKGKTLALVGRSGAGKTSMVNLLARFYDNYQGKILIDNVDIRKVSLKSLRQQIAMVSQNTILFNDTVFHNIAYGKFDKVDEKQVIAAAKAAHAWEFIKLLPQGLETIIGENGVLLSGGQKQRLAIARAILKDAPIFILDEATSSLDSESESYIQDSLQTLMKNRTTLVIAHRLSTIENADHIIVLDQGRIVESGTHQELLAINQLYANLYHRKYNQSQRKKN